MVWFFQERVLEGAFNDMKFKLAEVRRGARLVKPKQVHYSSACIIDRGYQKFLRDLGPWISCLGFLLPIEKKLYRAGKDGGSEGIRWYRALPPPHECDPGHFTCMSSCMDFTLRSRQQALPSSRCSSFRSICRSLLVQTNPPAQGNPYWLGDQQIKGVELLTD